MPHHTLLKLGPLQTPSSMLTLFLGMMLNPNALRKAQAEIDRVVGSGRLPRFEDRPNLPYIEAVYKEVIRWAPVVPLGEFF